MSKLCENCVVEHCADRNRGQVVFCSSHTTKPIQTHGDQIRAMSDEELANLLASKMANIKELEMAEKGIRVTATQLWLLASRLRDIWLQWLRQPAEE